MSTATFLSKNISHLIRNRIPGQVVIQTTNRCNALCPQCGMRRTADIRRASLSDKTVKDILHGCVKNGVQAVSFTGGEPLLLLDELIGWINHAGKLGLRFVRTGTNGFLFCGADHPGFSDKVGRLADRLSATPLRNFWISLDSCDPGVHERMRGLPGVVKGIRKALPVFHGAGLYPAANLGINRRFGGEETAALGPKDFNDRDAYLREFFHRYVAAFDRFYRFVAELGFTTVNTCYPMSISPQEENKGLNAVYGATAKDDVVRYRSDEKAMLYKALLKTIPRHRSRLRIFSPLSSLYALYRTHGDGENFAHASGCRGGVDFFFVDAEEGDTFPCGYRGRENLGKFWRLNLKGLRPHNGCRRCDWECFRDPSELCAPILQALHSPFELIKRMTGDALYRRLWMEDIKYYRRCNFFDGRKPFVRESFVG